MSFLWEKLVRPALFTADAESAHEFGLWALKSGFARPFYVEDPSFGRAPIRQFGLSFANPLGVAAGFDKNCLVVDKLAALGFGFVEVGTVTYHPQSGNPRPRLFRLPKDRALLNRMGFNNDGAKVVAERLRGISRDCVVGVNIGRNRDVSNEDALTNYLAAFVLLQPLADYIAINISSPNTPGLRDLQREDHLDRLLTALQDRNLQLGRKPLLVKIAPDLGDLQIRAIVECCMQNSVDGVIATNTTVSRRGLKTKNVETLGEGGISGTPVADLSNNVIATIRSLSAGKLPVIGVGGVFGADDARAKLASGATLLQAYTGFVYGGPRFAVSINQALARAGLTPPAEV